MLVSYPARSLVRWSAPASPAPPPAASAGAHPISLIAQLGPVSMSLGLRDLPLLEAVTAGLRRNGVPDLC